MEYMSDLTLLKIVDDVDRRLTRQKYEELLVSLGLYSLDQLREDHDYRVKKRDLIIMTLQARDDLLIILEALRPTLSQNAIRALVMDGIELGHSIAGELAEPIEERSRLEATVETTPAQDTETSAGDKLCEKHILVHIPRRDVYDHLRALCNNDARFALLEPRTDQDLGALTVTDAQATKPAYSARGAVIGTVRLLPMGSDTDIMFVAKDALFHERITKNGKVLFSEFIQRVTSHFEELALQQAKAATATLARDAEPGADKVNRSKLRQILTERFSGSELKNLCFDLHIEYDDLSGEGIGDKARELVSHCQRHERILELIERGKQSRSDIVWSAVYE